MNEILLIDKPKDWTSFDVVAKLRGKARQISGNKKIKVGHAGTLDPFATGLLVVLVGKDATKNQDFHMKQDKEYEATLKLGFVSTTGDPEGEITPYAPSSSLVASPGISVGPSDSSSEALAKLEGDPRLPPRLGEAGRKDDMPSLDDIEEVFTKFLGGISQIPPQYSAIKINGKRAYDYARNGETVEIKPRLVHIHEIDILNFDFPILNIRVKCGSGTYIRTLAEDIGKELGVGAYLTDLRRTKIGEFDIGNSLSVDEALSYLESV